MRLARVCTALIGSVFAIAALAYGQNIKPGLYENSSQVTWLKSPFPPGMKMPPGAAASSPLGEGKHTWQACVTQAEIDRYGAVVPEQWGNDCRMTNVNKNAAGMTANLVCAGNVEGRGTVEAVWASEGGGRGKVHFVGQMSAGRYSAPLEFISQYTSVYEGSDCGNVKPNPMPTD
jgi:Protein of unknown function (DUF3617)